MLSHSHIKGPLWATRGNETFSFLGAYNWCRQEHRALQKELKLLNEKLAKVCLSMFEVLMFFLLCIVSLRYFYQHKLLSIAELLMIRRSVLSVILTN